MTCSDERHNVDPYETRKPRKGCTTMKTTRMPLSGRPLLVPLNLSRTGMPAVDSIHEARRVIKSGKQRFRILRTTEVDDYESTPTAVVAAQRVAWQETAIYRRNHSSTEEETYWRAIRRDGTESRETFNCCRCNEVLQ